MPRKITSKRRPKRIVYNKKAIRRQVTMMMNVSCALVWEQSQNIEDEEDSDAQLIDICTSLYALWTIDLRNPEFRAQVKLDIKGISASPTDPPFVVIAIRAFAPHNPELLRLTRQIGVALEYLHSQRESDVVVRDRLTNDGFRHLAILGEMVSDVLPAKAPRGAEE